MSEVTKHMPLYQSHKQVRAMQIEEVKYGVSGGHDWRLTFIDDSFLDVPNDWISRHNPVKGGYYVVYSSGYASFSPGKEFEEGYTLILEGD